MTAGAAPPAGYLAAAREAGLVRQVAGRPVVVGVHDDGAGGERQGFIEYCDPALLAGNGEELAAAVLAELPAVDALVLRAPAAAQLGPPWLAHLTYVALAPAGPDQLPVDDATVPVRPAGVQDDEPILGWLVQAFETYGAEQRHPGDREAVRETAEQVLRAPDRVSYVVLEGDRPIGHATLLCEAADDVTAREYVELLDILVDAAPPGHGRAVAALESAARRHAGRLGRTLIGHVVHPADDDARARSILAALQRRGWRVDHRYWRRPQPRGAKR